MDDEKLSLNSRLEGHPYWWGLMMIKKKLSPVVLVLFAH